MHKSIFAQFFSFCYILIVSAIICVSTVHIFLSVETEHVERHEELSKATVEAVSFVQTRLVTEKDMESFFDACDDYFSILTSHNGISFALVNADGEVVSSSDGIDEIGRGSILPSVYLSTLTYEGTYSLGNMGGFYAESVFLDGYKIRYSDDVWYVIGKKNADSMRTYMNKLTSSYVVVAIIILVLFYPLLYFAISRLMKPVKEMSLSAKRFGEGDFSKKISYNDDNELGFLANSMNEMAGSLEKIEDDRKQFVSNVSHELKTPMTTIGGFVDGILDGTIPKNEHKYYLRIVSEEIDRLARLVRSMLNITKYESGEVELNRENFEGAALVFKTALLFEKKIENKKIEIEGLDMGRFWLCADYDLTQQVIYNLTENAIKFVNEGGTITFSRTLNDDYTSICIRNTGDGLKENEISQVFDRFYKTDESRGKDKTGVGLGLSIVRSIIKLHKGTILVRSEYGKYTEFEFTLPTGTPQKR